MLNNLIYFIDDPLAGAGEEPLVGRGGKTLMTLSGPRGLGVKTINYEQKRIHTGK